ncbi:MAG: hypothetical protein AB8B55_12205 [Mariniblastus sp.]
MSRIQLVVVLACVTALSVGCRNRCNPYGGAYGGFAGSPTIAAPATYSLQIPGGSPVSVANNQPYYTPGSSNSVLNTNSRAPTPATSNNGQLGWRQTGNDLSNVNSTNNGTPNQLQQPSRSVLTAPTTFVEVPNNGMNNVARTQTPFNVPTRTASTAPLPGSGQSFTDNSNYQTTRSNERADPSRLAVTDATSVIAPARNNPTGFVPGNFTAAYNAPIPQTQVAQNGYYQQGGMVYRGTPTIMGAPTTYRGQPMLVGPGYFPGAVQGNFQQFPTSSAPTVLAQANTTVNSGSTSNVGTQVGWQRRDIGSERF